MNIAGPRDFTLIIYELVIPKLMSLCDSVNQMPIIQLNLILYISWKQGCYYLSKI